MNDKFDVINFHLTEKCNYKCTYCFAKFKSEYELSIEEWKKAVNLVKEYFDRQGITSGRINLAGGEPLILDYLEELIDYIHSIGIKVSIITNASLVTKERIDNWVGKVDLLGISIDSVKIETNRLIGRAIYNEDTINLDQMIDVLNYAKQKNIGLKVNTVVSKFNLNENLNSLYKSVSFDKIKLLQVRINKNCNESAKEYEITSEEFNNYCKNVAINKGLIIESEDQMECSYIIIDPQGYLVTNKNNFHEKIGSIFKDSLEELIVRAEIRYDTFIRRYPIEKGDK